MDLFEFKWCNKISIASKINTDVNTIKKISKTYNHLSFKKYIVLVRNSFRNSRTKGGGYA